MLATLLATCTPPAPPLQERPNVLLIVADDLGYADLGAYGSPIRTPRIDELAEEGILFTQFHTAPMCAPTRAMLLSGNNNHVAGMGWQGVPTEVLGYEGHLSDRIAPLPRLLRDAGYFTVTTGKWHLGLDPENSPHAVGFERSFNLLDGAGSHYGSEGFFEGGSTYRDGATIVDYPDGSYSTELYTDRLIEFIDEGVAAGRPFFAFAAYTSPHWPLQVPETELDRYAGMYDDGYDALREQNFENLRAAGILAPGHELPPRNPLITPWDELDEESRRRESRKMELYAAMVENFDQHVGRLLSHLRDTGELDNTLVVFMSDNGAAAEDFYNVGGFVDYLRRTYDNTFENMGRPSSWVSYGPQWAEAGSAPFSRHKGFTREGGLVAPMIIAGPGVARGTQSDAYLTVMDLAPTILELAEAEYPADGSVAPMIGESMVRHLEGAADVVHDPDYVTALFHGGYTLLRQGDWKLIADPPYDPTRFELYNVREDPGETRDLSEAEPQRYARLIELWESERERLGIILPGEHPDIPGG